MFTDFSRAITITRYNILFIIMIFLSTVHLVLYSFIPHHILNPYTRTVMDRERKINFAQWREMCVASGSSHVAHIFFWLYRLSSTHIKCYRNLFYPDFSARRLLADFLASLLLLWLLFGGLFLCLHFSRTKKVMQEGMYRWYIGIEIVSYNNFIY